MRERPRVTLLVWRTPARRLARVVWRLARDPRWLAAQPGVRFAKVLGTGSQFRPGRPDLTRWAALISWHDAGQDIERTQPVAAWNALAHARLRLDLSPLTARGRWSGHQPFPLPAAGDISAGDGLVAPPPANGTLTRPAALVLAVTRATLRLPAALRFWRESRSVSSAVLAADGLLAALAIGEAPLVRPGTVSVWRSATDLVEFAYHHPAHRRVIDQTPVRRWYAEELFARFAVDEVHGDRSVIDWRDDATPAPARTGWRGDA